MNKRAVSLTFVSMLLLLMKMEMLFVTQVVAEPASSLAVIDVFTSKGGQGPNVPSDPFDFCKDEDIPLYAYLEYNGTPVPDEYVSFEFRDLLGRTVCARGSYTNASGIAFVLSRILTVCGDPTYYFGNWSVTATAYAYEVSDSVTIPITAHYVHIGVAYVYCLAENLDACTEAYPTWIIDVNVFVFYIGEETETFNVTAYCDNDTIGMKTVTVTPFVEEDLIFNWDLSNVCVDTHVIWANTSVPEPPGTIRASYTVRVKILGDASGDDFVDVDDLQIIGLSWQKCVGEIGYDPRADFNFDTLIDVDDLQFLGWNWLKP